MTFTDTQVLSFLKQDLADFGASFSSEGNTLRGWADYEEGVSIDLVDLLSQYSEDFDMYLVQDDVASDRIRFEITI